MGAAGGRDLGPGCGGGGGCRRTPWPTEPPVRSPSLALPLFSCRKVKPKRLPLAQPREGRGQRRLPAHVAGAGRREEWLRQLR